MSRGVSIFPAHVVVVYVCLCLLPRAALLDSWLSYCRGCGGRVHIVFRVFLTDPFSLLWRNSLSCLFAALGLGRSKCLHPAHEVDGLLPRPVWLAAHCAMHGGKPALGRHQPVSILVETSGCSCRGSRLIYQQVSLSSPEGAPGEARQARIVGRHSWPG